MYSANIKKLREETPDPLDINTIIIWCTISSVSGYSLAWDNNDFKPGKMDDGIYLWPTNRWYVSK